MSLLRFKVADRPCELEQVHALNYRAFVEEIPQHPPNEERRRVDFFHDENTYLVALDGDRLVGMLCARDRRPFSLDRKLDDLDAWLPPHRRPVELRLLVIEPAYRHKHVLVGLFRLGTMRRAAAGWDLAVISATTRQARLYAHIGFEPFGPLVGTPTALFQPMFLRLERFRVTVRRLGLPGA